MQNYIQKGNILDYTIPDDADPIKSGDIVIIGDLVGVASTDGEAGDTIAVQVNGVFELPTDDTAIDQGKKVYVVDGKISSTATSGAEGTTTDNTWAGYAANAAATTDATVWVKLLG